MMDEVDGDGRNDGLVAHQIHLWSWNKINIINIIGVFIVEISNSYTRMSLIKS